MRPARLALSTPVRELAPGGPIWADPLSTLDEVVRAMARAGVHHASVGSGGVARAVISTRDVARAMLDRGEGWRRARAIDVATAPPVALDADAPASEAVRLMVSARVGSVLLAKEGRIVGMVTERDLVGLAVTAYLGGRVRDVMTVDPKVARPGTSVVEALRAMVSGGFRHLPTYAGNSIRVASMDDVVNAVVEGRVGLEGDLLDCARGDPPIVDPASPLEEAVRTMAYRRTDYLLALDAGRLVGILTERDLVRRALAPLVSIAPERPKPRSPEGAGPPTSHRRPVDEIRIAILTH